MAEKEEEMSRKPKGAHGSSSAAAKPETRRKGWRRESEGSSRRHHPLRRRNPWQWSPIRRRDPRHAPGGRSGPGALPMRRTWAGPPDADPGLTVGALAGARATRAASLFGAFPAPVVATAPPPPPQPPAAPRKPAFMPEFPLRARRLSLSAPPAGGADQPLDEKPAASPRYRARSTMFTASAARSAAIRRVR